MLIRSNNPKTGRLFDIIIPVEPPEIVIIVPQISVKIPSFLNIDIFEKPIPIRIVVLIVQLTTIAVTTICIIFWNVIPTLASSRGNREYPIKDVNSIIINKIIPTLEVLFTVSF